MRSTKVLFAFITLMTILANGNAHARPEGVFLLPEFTQSKPNHWINSDPLQIHDLRGKVVLVDVWTYGCWNCYRSIPWLHSLEARFAAEEFVVIGIHTPEFEHEYVRENIERKIEEFQITHPVMMDNDFAYWNALDNRYWPTFYVADQHGVVRGTFIGETHVGDRRAKQVEDLIEQLLAQAKSR